MHTYTNKHTYYILSQNVCVGIMDFVGSYDPCYNPMIYDPDSLSLPNFKSDLDFDYLGCGL